MLTYENEAGVHVVDADIPDDIGDWTPEYLVEVWISSAVPAIRSILADFYNSSAGGARLLDMDDDRSETIVISLSADVAAVSYGSGGGVGYVPWERTDYAYIECD